MVNSKQYYQWSRRQPALTALALCRVNFNLGCIRESQRLWEELQGILETLALPRAGRAPSTTPS